MALLQTENLTFRYPNAEKNALSGVSVTVEPGEFVVIAGPSGSGKSTFLKLLKPEISPYGKKSGGIRFEFGAECGQAAEVGKVGFVFQDPESQIVTDRVLHELAFGMESLGLSGAEMEKRIAEITSYFGIGDLLGREVHDLSGGEKQMLNLSSVLVMRPELLLLDEPTAQLDPVAASNFLLTLQKLNRETGLTVIAAEHRLEEALPIADRFILLDRGSVVFSGKPSDAVRFFETRPDHPMFHSLPTAMRLFGAECLKDGVSCPTSVREGRTYLRSHYGNDVRSLSPSSDNADAAGAPAVREKGGKETPAIAVKNLWYRYEKDSGDVLRNASLVIRKGEHFAILGANGEGKSTALKLIAGLLRPYRGAVELFGRKTTAMNEAELYRRFLAMLPQDPKTLFIKKTLLEDLSDVPVSNGISRKDAEEKVRSIAKKLGLTDLLGQHPYDLSGGEQEKAALAKALLQEPKILLLDEPTKGLDASFKKTLSGWIRSFTESGVTVVTVTHDVEFAAISADRAAFLFNGNFLKPSDPRVFFSENTFYTTAASRISRDHYDGAVTEEDVRALMEINGRKEKE